MGLQEQEDTMPRLPNAADLISLQEAAAYAGYRSASTLRKAARDGTLRTVQLGPRAIMTTYDWVTDYEVAIAGKGARPRGTVRP
jgi:hypothetical protein